MSDEIHIHVSVPGQCVSVYAGAILLWQAPVSTAANGTGSEEGSYQTPLGWHHVAEKIGDDEPYGTVFEGRLPTGDVWSPEDPPIDKDLILTRILWLGGDEAQNATSRNRYIYFHGTNHIENIGTPASLGCIRLRNDDMLRLYEYAQIGTRVLIEE